eukprot:CAMPEP_0204181678 /NCGR_PEP_ID=MMETSP0361-20130328/52123_1 /ASSEMBLY_ACC=CAM_ASM_000343 /TAXON_ID=268821 /ORGANISM="Scrippsiella Hangoei, Strain SHTV-5" /LENGTH=306 /DNA_ID=CAMNT_0051141285 /DNA_START=43 /DNA_END=961 /DNA_ORIENTATION=-
MAMLPAGQRSLSSAASHDEADMIARGVLAVPSAGAQHRRIDAPSAPRLRPAADPVLIPDFLALEASAWPFVLEENPTLDPAAEGMWCDDFPMFEELEIASEHVLWSAVVAPPAPVLKPVPTPTLLEGDEDWMSEEFCLPPAAFQLDAWDAELGLGQPVDLSEQLEEGQRVGLIASLTRLSVGGVGIFGMISVSADPPVVNAHVVNTQLLKEDTPRWAIHPMTIEGSPYDFLCLKRKSRMSSSFSDCSTSAPSPGRSRAESPQHLLIEALPSLGAPSGDVSGKLQHLFARGGARAPTARSSGGVAPA